jgi:zinc transporter ZupT
VRGTGIPAAVGTLVLGLVLTVAFSAAAFAESFGVAACGTDRTCDIGTAQALLLVAPVIGVIALVLAIVGTVVLAVRRSRAWIPPIVAVALITIAGLVSVIGVRQAL